MNQLRMRIATGNYNNRRVDNALGNAPRALFVKDGICKIQIKKY